MKKIVMFVKKIFTIIESNDDTNGHKYRNHQERSDKSKERVQKLRSIKNANGS
jgi:hypothetical protein